jgi:hypothetical protein
VSPGPGCRRAVCWFRADPADTVSSRLWPACRWNGESPERFGVPGKPLAASRSLHYSSLSRHGVVCAFAARSAAPCAPSAVTSAGLVCTFRGHRYGQHPHLGLQTTIPDWFPTLGFSRRRNGPDTLPLAGGVPGRNRCAQCPASGYRVIRPVCGHCLGIEAREPGVPENDAITGHDPGQVRFALSGNCSFAC